AAKSTRKKSSVLGALASGLLPEQPDTAPSADILAERLPQTASLFPSLPIPDEVPPKKTVSKSSKRTTAQDILAKRLQNLHSASKKTAAIPATPVQAAPKSAIQNAQARENNEQQRNRTNLSPEYTFGTLVEGEGNRLAAAIAKNIAEKPGDAMYNPFFVYGSTGLGKTHLVQAVGNKVLSLNPQAKVRYIHTNEYLKNFMTTVRNKNWDNFKQQYLNYNLLIIDDIQFIQGKERTMEEFFFLFEHCHSRNQQIILTCDQLPSSLENMEQRLISRFSWGMTIKLEPPELSMRINILKHKAQSEGIVLRDDAALFIAQNIKQNVRELEGALKRVLARCRFQRSQTIDLDTAAEALQDIITTTRNPLTAELIMKAVADYYHIRISDLLGKKRLRSIARPRQIAMTLSKELTNMSLPAIGEVFGGRDHTTVMHAVKTVAKLRHDDEEIGQDYEKLLILIQN
ncbi:MAG: chromosomal replication initiator protein DnaA, partial [Conchiformibius sp.]|nr:chromosomal replication initiator protein DnaA [Conchiformibius sp.]